MPFPNVFKRLSGETALRMSIISKSSQEKLCYNPLVCSCAGVKVITINSVQEKQLLTEMMLILLIVTGAHM